MGALSDGIGTKVYIGPATTSLVGSALTGLTFVEIGEVESVGEFGDGFAAINFTSLSAGRVRKRKGAADAGDVAVVCANVPDDAGQIAANAAAKTKFYYAIKVVADDEPVADGDASVFYFAALVRSAKVNVGSSSAVNKRSYSFDINSDIHEIPASA